MNIQLDRVVVDTMSDDEVVLLVIDKIHKAGGYLERTSLPELSDMAYKYNHKQKYPRSMDSDDNYNNYCKIYTGKLRMCDHPVVKQKCKNWCK